MSMSQNADATVKRDLAFNTVSTVILDGVAIDAQGSDASLCLKRCSPPSVVPVLLEHYVRDGGPPQRRVSKLSPPGNLTVRLSAESQPLARGRTGSVHAVSVHMAPCSASESYRFPSLVIKATANPETFVDIAREGSFYEEMECLQGVAIPRCYGLFQVEVDDSINIPIWEASDSDGDTVSTNSQDDDDGEDLSVKLHSSSSVTKVFSILVLERLGGHLPVGQPLPPHSEQDLYDIYRDLSELGIFQNDIRWLNILQAPEDGLPSLKSPIRGRSYGWRIIDFDNTEKNNDTTERLSQGHEEYLSRLLDSLPWGCVIEPWD